MLHKSNTNMADFQLQSHQHSEGHQSGHRTTADISLDLLDPQSKSLSDFTCIGAEEVQAQHQLWGLPQAHHLKATLSTASLAGDKTPGLHAWPCLGARVVEWSFSTCGCQLFPSHLLACPSPGP